MCNWKRSYGKTVVDVLMGCTKGPHWGTFGGQEPRAVCAMGVRLWKGQVPPGGELYLADVWLLV